MMSVDAEDEGLVNLSLSPQGRAVIDLWSFVLQAVGVQHEVRAVGSLWDIFLHPAVFDFAKEEIAAFEDENKAWPPPPPISQDLGHDDISPFLLMLAMMFFYSVTGPWYARNLWFNAGAVDSEQILAAGEWWRLITGLTLHTDAAHLLGNVSLGGVFLYLLARQFGGGTASLIALFSGLLGNGLNLIFRHEAHLSVGFSTSVFGMVGAFCISRWFRTGVLARELLLSLGVAFGLLALLGSGGERTDLGAHLWGMAAGIFLGGVSCLPVITNLATSLKVQCLEFLIFVVMIWISWYLALSI